MHSLEGPYKGPFGGFKLASINQQQQGIKTMAKYQKTIDIWTLTQEQRKGLQAGQWITAGKGGKFETKGIWCGQGKAGNDVAIWLGNLASRKGPARLEHIRFMMQYAKG
jgi:hypothetical protein